MFYIFLLIHTVIAVALIGLILLQQGKGADIGAAFGSGSANTLFGSRGPASFLMKLTGGMMFLFFVTSLILGRMSVQHHETFIMPASQPQTVINGAATPSTPTSQKSSHS